MKFLLRIQSDDTKVEKKGKNIGIDELEQKLSNATEDALDLIYKTEE